MCALTVDFGYLGPICHWLCAGVGWNNGIIPGIMASFWGFLQGQAQINARPPVGCSGPAAPAVGSGLLSQNVEANNQTWSTIKIKHQFWEIWDSGILSWFPIVSASFISVLPHVSASCNSSVLTHVWGTHWLQKSILSYNKFSRKRAEGGPTIGSKRGQLFFFFYEWGWKKKIIKTTEGKHPGVLQSTTHLKYVLWITRTHSSAFLWPGLGQRMSSHRRPLLFLDWSVGASGTNQTVPVSTLKTPIPEEIKPHIDMKAE